MANILQAGSWISDADSAIESKTKCRKLIISGEGDRISTKVFELFSMSPNDATESQKYVRFCTRTTTDEKGTKLALW